MRHLPAVAIGLLWLAFSSWTVIAEHATYNSTSRDLPVYLQVIWNTAHGKPFHTTVLENNRLHLSEHVAPLLAAFAPAYAALPDPSWLLMLQQCSLAAAGIPVYLLARRAFG